MLWAQTHYRSWQLSTPLTAKMALIHKALLTWFAVLVFLILLVLRLDNKVTWNWFFIFTPMWLFDAVVTIYIAFNMIVHCKNGYDRTELTMRHKVHYTVGVFLKLSFQVLLCMRLQYYPKIELYYVMIPLWLLFSKAIVDVTVTLWKLPAMRLQSSPTHNITMSERYSSELSRRLHRWRNNILSYEWYRWNMWWPIVIIW